MFWLVLSTANASSGPLHPHPPVECGVEVSTPLSLSSSQPQHASHPLFPCVGYPGDWRQCVAPFGQTAFLVAYPFRGGCLGARGAPMYTTPRPLPPRAPPRPRPHDCSDSHRAVRTRACLLGVVQDARPSCLPCPSRQRALSFGAHTHTPPPPLPMMHPHHQSLPLPPPPTVDPAGCRRRRLGRRAPPDQGPAGHLHQDGWQEL
jgi:hypothetical protein